MKKPKHIQRRIDKFLTKAHIEQKKRIEELLAKIKSGDTYSAYLLACLCYVNAEGPVTVLRGYTSVVKFAKLALRGGCAWAGTLLGHLYSNSLYPKQDIEIAKLYYQKAATMGHAYALELLQDPQLSKHQTAKRGDGSGVPKLTKPKTK